MHIYDCWVQAREKRTAVGLRQEKAACKEAEAAGFRLAGQLSEAQHSITVLLTEQREAAVKLQQQVGSLQHTANLQHLPHKHVVYVCLRVYVSVSMCLSGSQSVCLSVSVYVHVCVQKARVYSWLVRRLQHLAEVGYLSASADCQCIQVYALSKRVTNACMLHNSENK